jgi:cell division protein FtsI/penicillin-binding protein 2
MRYLLIVVCIILVVALIGCGVETEPDIDITPYLNSLMAKDYDAMFSLCSPIVNIDKETFVQKYETIFDGLGINEITIDSLSAPDENGVFTYLATYKTNDYGDFTNRFTLRTGFIDGSVMVLWDYSLIFPEMSEGATVKVRTIHAQRGEIFAADGSILAANAFADTVYMDTGKVADITSVTDAVCPIVGLSSTKVVEMFNEALENETQIIVLGEFFADELTDTQVETILSVQGLGIDDEMYTPIRDYPMREYAAHMLGYTGFYTEENLPEGYAISDRAGLSGLEAFYESELRGEDGKTVFIEDKWGKQLRTLYIEPSDQGKDLRLTINPMLQKTAYDALRDSLDLELGETGVAIVMDAETGYIEAMASYPSYDNNLFSFGLSEETWQKFNAPESKEPLFSRATQGLYPPGSVFKPFTAAAALQNGGITQNTVFPGKIVNNQWTPEEEGWYWEQPITRIDDSGSPLKLSNALIHSDNIFFAYAALSTDEDDFINYLRRIGMEEAPPFDLPLKKANLVSRELDRRLIADMGYGQGEILLTPLQLTSMYTAFANESGDMLTPILVEKICQTDGLDYNTVQQNDAQVWKEDAVSGASLDVLLPLLSEVVKSGTGQYARISGVDIAGKTGTAEIGNDKDREISWFAGYWTDGYYPRLVVVMVDTAADEGAVKFDIAKQLLNP